MKINNHLAIKGNCSVNALGQKTCSKQFNDHLKVASDIIKGTNEFYQGSEAVSDDWKTAMSNPEGSFLDTMGKTLGVYISKDWITEEQSQALQQDLNELMASGQKPSWENIQKICEINEIASPLYDGTQWTNRLDSKGNLVSVTIPFNENQIKRMLEWFDSASKKID